MRSLALALALMAGCSTRMEAMSVDAYASLDAASSPDAAQAADAATVVDAFVAPDAASPDAFVAPDAYVGATFVLGAPFADCDTTCAAMGRTCGGPASVTRDCGLHADLPSCSAAGAWIYRHHAGEADACYTSWGTCDPCTLNYNTDNAFCCRCL